MRRLMLLRHAKSDWAKPGLRDHDRPLNPRGREAAPKMGAYMVRHALVPDLIVASTARRVTETLELAASGLRNRRRKSSPNRASTTRGANALLGIVKETPRTAHSLLLVGHNPGMAELASLLIASGDVDARQRLIEKFPTAGLAVIDFALDDWGKLHPRGGRLDRFVVPRALEAATD